MNASSGTGRGNIIWLYAGSVALFLLALFWTVDASVVYICLGTAAICFLQYFRFKTKPERAKAHRKDFGNQKTGPGKSLDDILNEIQKGFSSGSGKRLKTFFQRTLFFIVLFFAMVIIGVVLSDDPVGGSGNYWRGAECFDRGEYDSAAYYYRLAALEDPENPEIFYERGNAFLNLNRYDSSIAMYDAALALDKQHNNAHYNKGYALFQQKKYGEAIRATENVIRNNSSDVNAMLLLGDCYYNRSQLDSALQWYNGAYFNGYRSAPLSHMMAYIYDSKGQTPKAIDLYKEALSLDSSLVDIYKRLGELIPGEQGNVYRAKAVQLNSSK